MPITPIYEPIQEEMLQVEQSLKAIAKVDFPWLVELLNHMLKNLGKLLRPALTLLSGRLYRGNIELLVPMATAVELLHNATLVHDDTIDKSAVRRGMPTVNIAWGEGTAVLIGDYLFAKSGELVSSLGNPRLMNLLANATMSVCAGQLEETFSAHKWQQTRHDYLRRIGNKTAALFSAATESGAVLSQAPAPAIQALKDYGYNLGIAFQIVDDILDFVGEEADMGKPVGSDLLQGTLTLPAILLMERHPEENPIRAVFENKGQPESLKQALDMIRNSSIIADCYRIADGFCSQARQNIEGLPEDACRRSLFGLVEYVVERKN